MLVIMIFRVMRFVSRVNGKLLILLVMLFCITQDVFSGERRKLDFADMEALPFNDDHMEIREEYLVIQVEYEDSIEYLNSTPCDSKTSGLKGLLLIFNEKYGYLFHKYGAESSSAIGLTRELFAINIQLAYLYKQINDNESHEFYVLLAKKYLWEISKDDQQNTSYESMLKEPSTINFGCRLSY